MGTPNVWIKKENPRDAVRKEAKALLLLFLKAENPRFINVINPMQDGLVRLTCAFPIYGLAN